MKTNGISLFLVLAGFLIFSSCIKTDYFPCVKSSGSIIEELRPVGDINSIDLSMHANVFVHDGDENTIKIIAPVNLLDYIDTRQKGNKLVIETSRCIRSRSDEISVYVPAKALTSLRISGSGNIYVAKPYDTKSVDLHIAGSGNIHFSGTMESISSTITGSGNIIISGLCNKHSIQISGSGQIKSYDLDALVTDVRISGSGSANVLVRDHLDARISGSGNVFYKGNPSVSVNVSGSGKVIHVN